MYEQLLRDTEDEQARTAQRERELEEAQGQSQTTIAELHAKHRDQRARVQELEAACTELQGEVQRLREGAELQRLRAVVAEREKCEAREQRLVLQIEELQRQLGAAATFSHAGISSTELADGRSPRSSEY